VLTENHLVTAAQSVNFLAVAPTLIAGETRKKKRAQSTLTTIW
jgi:hypothetical protein